MKILIYGLNFAPEPTGIGKYSGELAAWLVAAGHEVRVIAAPPYYPAWKIERGYGGSAWSPRRWQGALVWRAPLWVPARPTGLKRILHLLSFAVMSLPALVRQAIWKPDVVMVIAPALACAPAGWLASRLFGAKAWLHVQDFEVDAAFRMGLLAGRRFEQIATALERWLYARFDRVSTISQRMMAVLRAKGVEDGRAVLFPNWVDVRAITPDAAPSAYRAELDIAPDAIVALYSGSMVGKQGLELLPAAARALQHSLPGLVFVLCGEGVFRPSLERDCAGLPNVRLLPLQPASRLGELLCTADIHMLTQHAQAADLVMPSKLTGMLSSGRPVVATAHAGTELARVVGGCGRVVAPNDLQAFTQALAELAGSPELRARLGRAARVYAEEHLDRQRVLADFERALKRCVGHTGVVNVDTMVVPAAAPGDDHAKTT